MTQVTYVVTMQGLLLRLSDLDGDAAAAVRVIAFFDALVERHASSRALVQATAGLAQCVAGLRRPDGTGIRLAPQSLGAALCEAALPSHQAEVAGVGTVWLERRGQSQGFDDLVVERFALAASMLARARDEHRASARSARALRKLLSAATPPDERADLAREVGLRTDQPVRVVAFRVRPGSEQRLVGGERGLIPAAQAVLEATWRAHRVYLLDDHRQAVVVVQPLFDFMPAADDVAGLREGLEISGHRNLLAGVSNARPADHAWQALGESRSALRFAGVSSQRCDDVVSYGSLGALRLLAEVPVRTLAADPDVEAIAALAASATGPDDLAALYAVCRTGSLRQASAELGLHHSTVADRLDRVARRTGWQLATPTGRLTSLTAIYAHHLCEPG
jgi:hypothetical protein